MTLGRPRKLDQPPSSDRAAYVRFKREQKRAAELAAAPVKVLTALVAPTPGIPWYLEDFRGHDLSPERELYARWKGIEPSNDAKTTEKWEVFFDLARLSPAFFIHELQLPIRTKAGRKVPFADWHPGQRLVYLDFLAQWKDGKPVRLIVLKARQVGMSTLCAALMFWRAVLFPDTAAVVMTDKSSHSGNVRTMVGIFMAWMQDAVPEEFVPVIAAETKGLIEWGKPRRDWQFKKRQAGGPLLDSSYRCMTAASSISERSWTVHALHASEVCFWGNAEDNWLGLSQAVADEPQTIVILESSADENSEFFKVKWDDAEGGKSDYHPVFIGWQTQAEYTRPLPVQHQTPEGRARYIESYDKDEVELAARLSLTPEQVEWRRFIIRDKCNNDPKMFRQEYPSTASEAFVSRGSNVYSPEAIFHYLEELRDPDKHPVAWVGEFSVDTKSGIVVPVPREDGFLTVYREPEAGKTYCLGVDPAEGHGAISDSDESVIQVVCADNLEQVAVYCTNLAPPEYLAKQVIALAQYYSNALIVPESNAVGGTLIFHLRNLMADPVFVREAVDRIGEQAVSKYGFYSTPKSKQQLIEIMSGVINPLKLILHHRKTVQQIGSFTRNQDGSFGPKKKKGHDDCHDALALALRGINSDQLQWHSTTQPLGLRRAGDLLRDAQDCVRNGRRDQVPEQLAGYFDPAFVGDF